MGDFLGSASAMLLKCENSWVAFDMLRETSTTLPSGRRIAGTIERLNAGELGLCGLWRGPQAECWRHFRKGRHLRSRNDHLPSCRTRGANARALSAVRQRCRRLAFAHLFRAVEVGLLFRGQLLAALLALEKLPALFQSISAPGAFVGRSGFRSCAARIAIARSK
jgi:hypothetical protein